MPICISLVLAFHGVGMTVTVALNGLRRFGPRPVIGEVVDHLLDAHAIGVRQLARLQRPAHEGIGGGIDIGREGRDRVGSTHLTGLVSRPT